MNNFFARFVLLLGLACVSVSAPAQVVSDPGDPEESRATIAIATKFLQILDKGKVSETWAMTGPILKSMVKPADWTTTLTSMRLTVGTLKRRDLQSAAFTKVIDGAPDGHYFVVFFKSQFSHETVEEKVILNLADGEWDVEGYFITPIAQASSGGG